MAIHSYIVEDPSTPEGFKNHLEQMIVNKSTHLKVTARLKTDELSARRSEEEQIRNFDFRVYQIHPDPEDFFLIVQDRETGIWSHITVAEEISITVVS